MPTRKNIPALPYGRQWISGDDVAAATSQLQDDWLTQGPTVARFEQALAEYCGARYAVAVSSGTAALHLAALAAEVGPGKVGVTSAITFVASANCIAYAGGTPSFADVDPESGLLDTHDLERRCEALAAAGTLPAVLIPVDLAGQPADLPQIREIADRYGAKVIEDAAHSLGASYTHEGSEFRCGSCAHTEMAILSFHPVKHITTGEGGAVFTNDASLHQRLLDLRSHGITKDPARLCENDGPWYHEQQGLGFNYRLTDLQCALGLSQMKRLAQFVARRRALAAQYDGALAQTPFKGKLAPLAQRTGTTNSYHLYVVRLLAGPGRSQGSLAEDRRKLYDHLIANNIRPQVHYIPVPQQPYYRNTYRTDPMAYPGAAAYYASCLSLPLFPAMADEDVGRVVEALEAWVRKA